MHPCRQCGESKAREEFYSRRDGKPWRDCKVCVRRDRAEKYRSDPLMRERLIAAAKVQWANRPHTQQPPCTRCGEPMARAKGGRPGICKPCRRVLGYKIQVTRAERLAIYERDKWNCWLCSEPVDATLHPNDRMAATLDHVAPRSTTLFPDDSAQNLRLAHRACNSGRGARTAPRKAAA